ncbi:hypothetical protein GCM10007874_31820 [Labrys miyagiensis]|uniref:Uncharacterized protein n=1 Tax=Labrys miyagiensis TaxID=346912 RepID=A0ABQ6CJ17_9HYPH|nr:hypothetical protein GCM10007874_31820 [Labrys miyagiensis]
MRQAIGSHSLHKGLVAAPSRRRGNFLPLSLRSLRPRRGFEAAQTFEDQFGGFRIEPTEKARRKAEERLRTEHAASTRCE